MGEDNEKKVSGEMNEDELENVAGGFCLGNGVDKRVTDPDIKSVGGYTVITTKLDNGDEIKTYFNPDGTLKGRECTKDSVIK